MPRTRDEWWIVFDTLRQARAELVKYGREPTWMDEAIRLAKMHAGLE